MIELTKEELDEKLKNKNFKFVGIFTKKTLKPYKDKHNYFYIDSNPRKDVLIDFSFKKKEFFLYQETK